MQNTFDLLKLYREEKSLVAGDELMEEASFPSFQEWKAEYEADRAQNYVTVSVEEADKMIEDDLAEVDSLFKQPASEKETTMSTAEVTEVTTTNETTTSAAPETEATSKPARKRVAKPEGKKTKMELARAVMKRFSRGKAINRAKVLEVLQKEVKLTAKGASTYYQKLRTELGKPSA
jgi:hypothetical protein